MIENESRHRFEEVHLRIGPCNAVSLPRIHHELEGFSLLNQSVDHLYGVLEMNVVIRHAVREK